MSRQQQSQFGISKKECVNLIVQECMNNKVTDPKQIAYILGTAQHESGNFKYAREIGGASQAKRLGYEGGADYAGRGFVQLTHKSNYEKMDRALGLNGALIKNPELAADPKIAAKILVVGMRDGMFTGKPLGKFINGENEDFMGARRVVNGVLKSRPETITAANLCGSYAKKWEGQLDGLIMQCRDPSLAAKKPEPLSAPKVSAEGMSLKEVQKVLNAIGFRDSDGKALAVDGILGKNTKAAVEKFQIANRLQPDGIPGEGTKSALAEKFNDIRHKDFNLVNNIRDKLHTAEAKIGKVWNGASENISAALGFAAKTAGIDRADAVEFSKDLAKVAVLRSGPGLTGVLAYVVVKEAMEMPASSSLRNMHDVGKFAQNVAQEFGAMVIPGQTQRRTH